MAEVDRLRLANDWVAAYLMFEFDLHYILVLCSVCSCVRTSVFSYACNGTTHACMYVTRCKGHVC